jgi:LysR family transcriptional regulator, transcriptional activator of the cysJI operon
MLIDKRLRVFLTVAECGSYSQASRKLSLAQSVVSHHVDALEKDLSVPLFRKQGRGIVLTSEGEILQAEGKKLLKAARKTEDTFSNQSATVARKINIAGDALTCSFTLPWALAAFRTKNPDVLYSYKHRDTSDLVDKIISGDVDMALVGHSINHRKLVAEPCFLDEIVLVGSARSAPSCISQEQLVDLPIFWFSNDPGLEQVLTQSLAEISLPVNNLNIFMEVEDLPILLTFIRAGVGYAFLPKVAASEYLDSGELRTITVEGLDVVRTNYRVYLKTRPQREIVNEFLEFIRSAKWGEMSTLPVVNTEDVNNHLKENE